MKIGGQVIAKPKDEIVVIPRGDQNIILKASAVLDFSELDKLCPEPVPPTRHYPDGREEVVFNDKQFNKKREQWAMYRSTWLILESLKATEGLEWETVDYSKPETWENYRVELEKVFTTGEINAIIGVVMKANSLDDKRFDEAKNLFLAQQQ